MALSTTVKRLLNNATPGLFRAKLGDIIDDMLTSQLHAGGNATTEAAGLMSAADKTKLNGVAASANNYTLPAAGASIGGVKKGVAVADAVGATPTAAEYKALLDSLRAAGVIATA